LFDISWCFLVSRCCWVFLVCSRPFFVCSSFLALTLRQPPQQPPSPPGQPRTAAPGQHSGDRSRAPAPPRHGAHRGRTARVRGQAGHPGQARAKLPEVAGSPC
jgi:hypothetical protein